MRLLNMQAGSRPVAPEQVQRGHDLVSETDRKRHAAIELGKLEHLGSALGRLGKSAELGKTRDQPGPIADRCGRGKIEKLMGPVSGQFREIGGGQFDRPRVFGPLAMHLRKVGCGLDAQFQVPEARGEFQRPGTGRERLVQLAEHRVEVY